MKIALKFKYWVTISEEKLNIIVLQSSIQSDRKHNESLDTLNRVRGAKNTVLNYRFFRKTSKW